MGGRPAIPLSTFYLTIVDVTDAQENSMPFDAQLADRVRGLTSPRKGFAEKKMFGGIGFLLNGNMCVGVWKEFLIVRLGLKNYQSALNQPFVKEFDITGKAMRGWVMIEPDGIKKHSSLSSWIGSAIRFVRTIPEKILSLSRLCFLLSATKRREQRVADVDQIGSEACSFHSPLGR